MFDSVLVFSGTHDDKKRIEEEGRLDEWCADNLKYFADTFGKENTALHREIADHEETIEGLPEPAKNKSPPAHCCSNRMQYRTKQKIKSIS